MPSSPSNSPALPLDPPTTPLKLPPPPPPAPFYPFPPLISAHPELLPLLTPIPSPPFSRTLNHHLTVAILKLHFNLHLHLPPPHLTPAIPNRVQYLHWAFSLLSDSPPTALDLCTGPSVIYPLLSSRLYPTTHFIAADCDPQAISLARRNILQNKLSHQITLIHTNSQTLLPPSLLSHSPSLLTCNPPFHDQPPCPDPNTPHVAPPGTPIQLSTPGGELSFLKALAKESTAAPTVHYFTSLIGCKRDLRPLMRFLSSDQIRARYVYHVELCPGGRTVRWAVAWTFGRVRSHVWLSHVGKWRVVARVECARRYANLLDVSDMEGVFVQVFVGEGWQREEGGKVRGTKGEKVTLVVEEGDKWGCFKVTLKVTDRGSLGEGDFSQGISGVLHGVARLLDNVEDADKDSDAVSQDELQFMESDERIGEGDVRYSGPMMP